MWLQQTALPLCSTQHCLLSAHNTTSLQHTTLPPWKTAAEKGESFGALLTDLSKEFRCFSHELLLANFHAYAFNISALRLIHSYLTNRKQRTKIHSVYSSWVEILFRVPKESILGPLLFNIFLCDIFLIMNDTNFCKLRR